ncbi:thiol reductant ABC exporter subunit CydC [Lysobacter sp.]|uniref:thiol reductant ABC exporter subunit CydC n=1 Tax=Lysobacter sp. TaxID=72226 RepID=UPI002D3635EF|nr:thiol reductant ABC exporter subunit CydC [Lysobacter sp.]HZX77294.1 thiol reductant ABC exporter subunit CydC [Lysobacter sp.]
MWPMLLQRRRALLPAAVLALLTAAAAVGLLGVSGWFLTATALVSGALATFNLFVPSATVRALAFVRILSRYGERLTGHAATLRLLNDLRIRVFANLLRLDAGQVARWRDGDLIARLTGDIDALDSTFLLGLLPLMVGAVIGVIVVAVLTVYVPLASVAVGLLWLVLLLGVPAWSARRVRRSGVERQWHAAMVRQQVLQAVDGHADLLALGAEARAEAELADSSDRLRAAALSESQTLAWGQVWVVLGVGGAMLIVAATGAVVMHEGQLGGALLVGCTLAVAGVFEVMAPVLRGASRLGAATAAAQRVREIEDTQPQIVDPPRPWLLDEQGMLEFDDVRFRYDPALPVLESVNLRIAPGERMVVSGVSGTGKSTLLALLLRLRDPQAGEIRWGGVDLREASLAQWHRRVALLPQDSPVFRGTVRDNLQIGRPNADDAALWNALRQAGLEADVRALPAALDQWLGEGGRTLSAGQARRLCLARVLLSDASLIALDEPTEGLDPSAEQAFFRSLPTVFAGRSLLLITHAVVPDDVVDATWELVGGHLLPCGRAVHRSGTTART